MGRSKKTKSKEPYTLQSAKNKDKKSIRVNNRSSVLGIVSLATTCLNLVTIFTTYRAIIILLPAPIVLGIIGVYLSKKDKNETGFVYSSIALLIYGVTVVIMLLMFFMTQLWG